ncbi:ankyrin repeat protein SKIP35-like [Magnolia sinica]|uniref:ankyrin repeat protein SKIP35-like n=1 Tax=Magnolia sinica TaxID=86752 RepID=UPI00265849EE|nr:ankyrin repeat protein SKIP35-like [Magnolia sinica]
MAGHQWQRMDDKSVRECGGPPFVNENPSEDMLCSEMETDEIGMGSSKDNGEAFSLEKGEGSNVVFSREAPLLGKDLRISSGSSCSTKKLKSRTAVAELELHKKDKNGPERKLSRQDRIELGRMFQGAVSSHDWELAESLILLADPLTLNDALCISLDSIWFLSTQQELHGITGMIEKIISNGAYDFTRAALRTSFLASCVSACQSRTMSLADTVTVMAQRLHERLKECNGDEVLKAEAGAKVQKFTEWALKCIGFHSRSQGKKDKVSHSSSVEIQLQLSAFKTFLDLAGNQLTGKDFTEAFDAACFPLTLFSSSFDPGWASGISATAIQGLLGLLVEWGADNVNQCFLEASRFGSTELVRILLQIAQRNSLDVDVDLALGFASHYGKIGTMECLVEEGNAVAFLGPLMRAAERGCMQVVRWFVERGCRDMELCLALTAATSSSQVGVAAYLLPHVPQHVLAALSIEILKAAGERSAGSLDGVAFLLHADFLGDPAATYAVADSIAGSDDEAVAPELRTFLREHWSVEAFADGLRCGQEHYVNVMRILRRGGSPICLRDLPAPLRVAAAYLPLYRECVETHGPLLSQRLRGQLVEAVTRLGNRPVSEASQGGELLAVLEHHLPPFLVSAP